MKARTSYSTDGILLAALDEDDLERVCAMLPSCTLVRFNCGHGIHIEKSMAMMDGKKMDLFLLCLSFIGWMLLAMFLTFGIGFLWVLPYICQSVAAFYEDLKAETPAV